MKRIMLAFGIITAGLLAVILYVSAAADDINLDRAAFDWLIRLFDISMLLSSGFYFYYGFLWKKPYMKFFFGFNIMLYIIDIILLLLGISIGRVWLYLFDIYVFVLYIAFIARYWTLFIKKDR